MTMRRMVTRSPPRSPFPLSSLIAPPRYVQWVHTLMLCAFINDALILVAVGRHGWHGLILLPCLQRIQTAKAELLGKCRVNMKLDNDDCSRILEYLDWLVRAVWPKQYLLRSRAWKLRTLAGVHLRLEGKAVKKQTGLAGILYTEFFGDAGFSIFRRLDAACQSAAGGGRRPPLLVAQPEAMVSVGMHGRGPRGRGFASGGGGRASHRREDHQECRWPVARCATFGR